MKIQFKLRDPKSESDTLIILVTYIKGERLVYSIGESINPKYWDSDSPNSKSFDIQNGYQSHSRSFHSND